MVIGIDLGTTFSVGAYVDKDGTPHVVHNRDGANTTPSVVMFDEDEILVGIQAKNNAELEPANVIQFVKRSMGDKEWDFELDGNRYTAEDISALILKRIKEDCEAALGESITQAVITVPAYFTDAQKQSTKDAGRLAGLDVLRIINEPTAAALAYGMGNKGASQKVMIYDLGGGTFDVTIMEICPDNLSSDNPEGFVKVLATDGNRNLGGYDFDNRLISYITGLIREEIDVDIYTDDEALQILRAKCEEAKIALSTSEKFRLSLIVGGKKFRTEITREKFEELIADLIESTEDNIENALDGSGLQPQDIDKILLVGGSTRIPAVQKFVEQRMKMKPSTELNPDEVVAIGAAILASNISSNGNNTREIIQDVNSHGLGVVIVIDEERGILGNSIIIPRNQQIPVMRDQEYYTISDNQKELEVEVTEGDDDDLSYVTIVGKTDIHINPHPKGSPVRVELGYDKDGLITCRVFDVTDNCYIGDAVFKRKANLTEDEIKSKMLRMSTTVIR